MHCWKSHVTAHFSKQSTSVDPDQSDPKGAVLSGSSLVASESFLINKSVDKITEGFVIICKRRENKILSKFKVLCQII